MTRLRPLRAVAACWSLAFVLAAAAAPGAGDVPPARVGMQLDGDPVLLTDHAGKAIVVSYWATWCPYCLKELPILANMQRVAGKDRMQVIAVNTESRDVFRKAVRTLNGALDITLAYDKDGRSQEAYGVKGIPHMVIVGRDGRIVAVYRGYNESSLDAIAADLNRALGDPVE